MRTFPHLALAARRLALVVTLTVFPLAALAAAGVDGSPYRGNADSRIFHAQSCRYFDCKKCTVEFASRDQAEKAGYRACKVCRP